MSDESPEAKIARIDERTMGMSLKLDKFIDAHEIQRGAQDTRIERLEAHKNWLAGLGAAVTAIFGFHVGKH